MAVVLALLGCGDGGSSQSDGSRGDASDASGTATDLDVVDVSRDDRKNPADVAAADAPSADVPGGLDLAQPDRARDVATPVDTGGEAGPGETAPPAVDPCAPTALVPLSLAGPGQVTVAGTLHGSSALKPKTAGCGAGPTGPEIAYTLALPAGEFHLTASTVAAGTTADTLVYVQTACGGGTELACNDDVSGPGPSRATTPVSGPGTIYIVVDSLPPEPPPGAGDFTLTVSLATPVAAGSACTVVRPGETDPCAGGFVCPPAAGAAATCTAATAPVVDAIEVLPQLGQPATEVMLYLSAHDPDGDWRYLMLAYRDATGAMLDSEILPLNDDSGQATLAETALPLSVPPGMTTIDASLVDSRSLASASVNVPLTPWSALGQTCDARLTRPDPCLGDLVCSGTTCAATSKSAADCAQAAPIALDTPLGGVAADLAADTFEGSCHYDRGGHDKVLRATLPPLTGGAVAWDLVASTTNPNTPYDYLVDLDTYVYVRASCADPASELACSDDVDDTDFRSQAVARDLPPGDYYVFLDTSSADQNGSQVAYTLVVRARPVLATGAVCDPAGASNRCQAGACNSATDLCP
jgi:hypothetical protein